MKTDLERTRDLVVHTETLLWLCREARRQEDTVALAFVGKFLSGLISEDSLECFRDELRGIDADSPSQDSLEMRRIRAHKPKPNDDGGIKVLVDKPLPVKPPGGASVQMHADVSKYLSSVGG